LSARPKKEHFYHFLRGGGRGRGGKGGNQRRTKNSGMILNYGEFLKHVKKHHFEQKRPISTKQKHFFFKYKPKE